MGPAIRNRQTSSKIFLGEKVKCESKHKKREKYSVKKRRLVNEKQKDSKTPKKTKRDIFYLSRESQCRLKTFVRGTPFSREDEDNSSF